MICLAVLQAGRRHVWPADLRCLEIHVALGHRLGAPCGDGRGQTPDLVLRFRRSAEIVQFQRVC